MNKRAFEPRSIAPWLNFRAPFFRQGDEGKDRSALKKHYYNCILECDNKSMGRRMALALTSAASLGVFSTATSYARDSSSYYLERPNDIGLVAFCASKRLLPGESERFFKAHVEDFHCKLPPTAGGDLHESKGRQGISYLQGDELPLEELAAANGVELADVCHEYRNQISRAN